MADDLQDLLKGRSSNEKINALHQHERTGRPLGDKKFIQQLEIKLGKSRALQKGSPKKIKKLRILPPDLLSFLFIQNPSF